MGSLWFLLLLLLLSKERAFILPGSVLVCVAASGLPSTRGSNENLPCQCSSSVLPHQTNGHNSVEELNSSPKSKTPQGEMTSTTLPTSPQSSSKTGPTEQTASVTNSTSLLDATVTSIAKELAGSPKTTALSLTTSTETPQPSQTSPSSTQDKAIDTNKPLPTATTATMGTSSPTTTMLRTTVLNTATSETQERDTTAVLPSPVTSPTTSQLPDTHHSTVTQTPSQTVQMGSSTSPGTTQASDHSTGLAPGSPETIKSSTIIGTSKAPPNSNQNGSPGDGTCALDEYPASIGGCACNNSYYSHLELDREIATLRCGPQDIEVSLRSCFLKTQHWVLKQNTFEKCSSINMTEQGHRVQVFQLEKKERTCGLHISTNSSHALYSLDVHLEQALPGSITTVRVLQFSCAYPLAVNISKPVSYQEVSIPAIHVPNTGETVVTLSIFTDPQLSVPLKNSTAPVGVPLYVVLKSTNSDPDRFALVANEIFASTNLSNKEPKATYHFVKESCPVQGRMLQNFSNGASVYVTLAFILSRFLDSDMLYLHAQVTLCDKQVGHPCQPSCSGKNPLQRNSPWDTRTGTQMEPGSGKWIVFGPLRISESRASGSRNSAGAWISIFLLIVIGWMLE